MKLLLGFIIAVFCSFNVLATPRKIPSVLLN